MTTPNKNNPELAKSQFKEDLEGVPKYYVKRYGWRLKPEFDDLRLYMDMWSVDGEYNHKDDFHVVMDMSYYNNWPPGVTFINPTTKVFDPNTDMRWLPKISSKPDGIDIAYHVAYELTTGTTKQMVCNSMTLEYYQSNHNPDADERWDPNKHTLFATISMIQTMLTEPHYGGRGG